MACGRRFSWRGLFPLRGGRIPSGYRTGRQYSANGERVCAHNGWLVTALLSVAASLSRNHTVAVVVRNIRDFTAKRDYLRATRLQITTAEAVFWLSFLIHCCTTMNLPTFAAALALGTLAWAGGPNSPTQTTAPAKKATTATTVKKAPATTTVAAKKPVTSTATASAKHTATRKAPVVRTTWRNRQSSPTTDRYREIQQALVARGYLSQDDANGVWGSASTDALKKFQAEQTLDSTGKIDSLSLIALGLGPKHDTLPAGVVDGNFQAESGRN